MHANSIKDEGKETRAKEKKPEPALISFVLPAFVQQTHAGSSYLPMCSYMELKTISA